MPDITAKQLIARWEREYGKQANTRSLWQDTANVMWPHAQINTQFTPGTNRMKKIYDTTPMLDMLEMVSEFKQVLMPAGQTFFVIKTEGDIAKSDRVTRYLNMLTAIVHDKLFASNLSLKLDDILISMITFGPGCLFVAPWTKKKGLNYKSAKIGSYVIIEDDFENVIGSIHRFRMSAIDAYTTYKEKAGAQVLKAVGDNKTANEEFWFLYEIMPNTHINPLVSKSNNKNMPYQATVVNEKDLCTVDEEGFPENPYPIARWMRPEYERDGRGIGTEMLPQIDILFQIVKDYTDCGNRWNHPPRQGLVDSVEGQVDARPDAMNWVTQIDAIRSLDTNLNGNFPYTEKSLINQREIIDRAFYKNAFDPLAQLTGDRRTQLEIQERIRGSIKKLGPPVGRYWYELMSPTISRSTLELIRNRQVPPPPPELAGVNFGIEYIGPLALALKSEQASGLMEWENFVEKVNVAFPDSHVGDNIDWDDAIPRIGLTFGVNVEDIASDEERQAKRDARAQKQRAQEELQAAMASSKSYKDATGAPEGGSPAEALMAGAG